MIKAAPSSLDQQNNILYFILYSVPLLYRGSHFTASLYYLNAFLQCIVFCIPIDCTSLSINLLCAVSPVQKVFIFPNSHLRWESGLCFHSIILDFTKA